MSDKLATIRALLAKAEDPSVTEAEAEAYNVKAAELIAKYGIDAALLAEARPETDKLTDKRIEIFAPYAVDKMTLLYVILKAFRCEAIRVGHGKSQVLRVYGYASDIERSELLYTSLLLQANTGLVRAQRPSWEQPQSFKKSWLSGFTNAVGRRLKAAEAKARGEAEQAAGRHSVELAIVNREDQVRSAYEKAHPNRTKTYRRLNGSGSGQGYKAGERADLGYGKGVSAGNRQALSR